MKTITTNTFDKLVQLNASPSISLFIPTEKTGRDVLEGKDRIHLKTKWNECKHELSQQGYSDELINTLGAPILELIEDKNFWRQQNLGLAIYRSEDFFETLKLPVSVQPYCYISNEFYIKPLIPYMLDHGNYYLLHIQLGKIELFECDQFDIKKIEIEEFDTMKLQDNFEEDYNKKNLQVRSQGVGGHSAGFHDHSDMESDKKIEIIKFFEEIDDMVNNKLDQKSPLLIACTDYLFPLYQESNNYNNLFNTNLSSTLANESVSSLHDKSWDVIKSYFQKSKNTKWNKYQELEHTDKTSSSIHKIMPAIQQGKVDTLFISDSNDIWGNYAEDLMKVRLGDEHMENRISLLNKAAKMTLEKGGIVYMLDSNSQPEEAEDIYALYRF